MMKPRAARAPFASRGRHYRAAQRSPHANGKAYRIGPWQTPSRYFVYGDMQDLAQAQYMLDLFIVACGRGTDTMDELSAFLD
jgi:hypothetical protein